jgi:adenylate cyclase
MFFPFTKIKLADMRAKKKFGRRLTKTRYDVPWKTHTIEIDVYRGRHDGLVVAEVEFKNQRSCRAFEPPDWIGRDVTGSPKYSNVALAHK